MADCKRTTKKGKPCGNKAMHGRDVCKQHSGDPDVGQRTKLTAELIEEISGYISKGVPTKFAAEACGISESIVYYWCEQGEADREQGRASLHLDFLESRARARSEFLSAHAMNVSKHAVGFRDGTRQVEGDWRASAWLLERRGGGEWREKVALEHGGEVRTRDRADLRSLSDEQLEQLDAMLAEAEAVSS